MKATRLLYVVLVLAVGFWLWSRLGTGDEARIRAQLDRLEALVEKSSDETALEAADGARQLAELFTREFQLVLEPAGARVQDAAALARPYVGLRRQAERISMDISELEIGLAEDLPLADSTFVATLSATVNGQPRRASYPVTVRWRKERGEWRMEEIHVGHEVGGVGSLF